MPTGPLPNPNRRRRNAPTIPTTNLPARGRRGRPPNPRSELGDAGLAWWRWAWATPQAAAWSRGDDYVLVRRASLEDDLAACARVEGFDLLEGLDAATSEKLADFKILISRLVALASGRLQLMKEARELDDRLGLTPKGLAALRWTIVDDAQSPAATPSATSAVSDLADERRRRLVNGAG